MARVACVKCSADIKLSAEQEEGSVLACPACGIQLKIVTDGEYLQTVEKEKAA